MSQAKSNKMGVVQLTILTMVNMMGSGIIMLPTKLAEVGTISVSLAGDRRSSMAQHGHSQNAVYSAVNQTVWAVMPVCSVIGNYGELPTASHC